jgi:hypothetical protein
VEEQRAPSSEATPGEDRAAEQGPGEAAAAGPGEDAEVLTTGAEGTDQAED